MKTEIYWNGHPIIVEHRAGRILDVRDKKGNLVSIDNNKYDEVMNEVRKYA